MAAGLANSLAEAGGDAFATMPGPQRAAALLLMLAVLPGGAVFLWLGAVLVGLLFYAFLRLSLPATCT